jgi:hypothetical protein
MLGILFEITAGILLTAGCSSEYWSWSTSQTSCTDSEEAPRDRDLIDDLDYHE